MGGDSADWNYTGELPSQVYKKAGGDLTSETYIRDLLLTPSRRRSEGGGIGGYGDLYLHTTEYVRAVNCDATYS